MSTIEAIKTGNIKLDTTHSWACMVIHYHDYVYTIYKMKIYIQVYIGGVII